MTAIPLLYPATMAGLDTDEPVGRYVVVDDAGVQITKQDWIIDTAHGYTSFERWATMRLTCEVCDRTHPAKDMPARAHLTQRKDGLWAVYTWQVDPCA